MSNLLVQRSHSANTGDKTISFRNPTTPGNLIILVMTWDQDPPVGGYSLANLVPPTSVPHSNIIDDGGNIYNVVTYSQDNVGIWSTGPASPSVSCQTITVNPHWIDAGNNDHGIASPAGLRLRAYEVQRCPQSPQLPNPQGNTNIENNQSTGLSYGLSNLATANPSVTISSGSWSDHIGAQAFYIAVLGPSVFGPTNYNALAQSVNTPFVIDDPFNDTAVAILEASADADAIATFHLSSAADAAGYAIMTGSWESTDAASLWNGQLPPAFPSGAVVDPNQSTVVASPVAVLANGTSTSTITVTLLTSAGAPVSGKTVSLIDAGSRQGHSVISPASGPSDSNGRVTFTVTDTHVEAVTYAAVDNSDVFQITQRAFVLFVPPISRYDLSVYSAQGPCVPGASVYVLNQGGYVPAQGIKVDQTELNKWPLAPIFSDAGQTPLVQPAVTSGLGMANFYAASLQTVTVVIVNKGFTMLILPDQSVPAN